jgi:hypothetical protein
MLQGRFERTFHSDGLECTIWFPLDRRHDRERADQA